MGKGRASVLVLAVAALVGSTFAGAAQAKGVAFLSGNSNNVDAETIDAVGGLTPATLTATDPVTDRNLAMSPDARFLYVNSSQKKVSGFSVNGTTLTPVPGSPYDVVDTFAEGIAMAPNGQFLFSVNGNGGAGSASIFSRNADGSLTQVDADPGAGKNFPLGYGVEGIAIDPSGTHAYMTDKTNNTVHAYSIASTGLLTAIGTPRATGTAPEGVVLTPDGRSLFVGSLGVGGKRVDWYAIEADGTLSASAGSAATGGTPRTLAVTQDGLHLYAANGSGGVNAFSIGAGGALTPVPGQPFTAFGGPFSVDAAPSGILYASDFAPKVNAYSVAADGVLANISGSPFTTQANGVETQGLIVTPNQGPVAAVTASLAPAGSATTLDASASADTDGGGAIAGYAWDFGDGQTQNTTTPTTSHTYTTAGTYKASVTVTDSEGCSDKVLFTGQTADCNGSAAAKAALDVVVPPTPNQLALALSGKKKQKLDAVIEIGVSCGGACTADASGKLIVRTPKPSHGKQATKGTRKTFPIKQVFQSVAAGGTVTLKLKLSKKARRAATKALAAGGSVSAKLTVGASDSAGNAASAPRSIKLTK